MVSSWLGFWYLEIWIRTTCARRHNHMTGTQLLLCHRWSAIICTVCPHSSSITHVHDALHAELADSPAPAQPVTPSVARCHTGALRPDYCAAAMVSHSCSSRLSACSDALRSRRDFSCLRLTIKRLSEKFFGGKQLNEPLWGRCFLKC